MGPLGDLLVYFYWGLQWWNNALLPPYPRLSNHPDGWFDTMAPLDILGRCSLPSPPAPPPHGHHLVGVSVSLSLRWWVQRWAVGEERDKQYWFDVVFINFYLLWSFRQGHGRLVQRRSTTPCPRSAGASVSLSPTQEQQVAGRRCRVFLP